MHSSSLADFVSRLNIAKAGRLKSIYVKNTSLNIELLYMFVEFGIIYNFKVCLDDDLKIEVFLRFGYGFGAFKKLKLISKPSKKVYVNAIKLSKIKGRSSSSFFIISTSRGLLFDHECLYFNSGGKILIQIIL